MEDVERDRQGTGERNNEKEGKERRGEGSFFLAGCCMAQRLRCPGGRPSVSYEWEGGEEGGKQKRGNRHISSSSYCHTTLEVRCVGPKDEGERKGSFTVSAKELRGGNYELVIR